MNPTVLSLKDIHLEVGTPKNTVLKDINLDVSAGDCIMLVGSNGSGKSSLLKVINGLYKQSLGSIDLLGNNLLTLPLRKRSQFIATINQDPDLSTFSQLTVYENFLMAIMKKKGHASGKTSRHSATEYLTQFHPNLGKSLYMPAGQLSGGERQSLGLALCLMHIPDLLLFDEHTSALDPASAKKVMEMTAALIIKNRSTAIICTHNIQDALHYGNRLIIMQKGHIVFDLPQEKKELLTKEELLALY